jgi:hypothetical protein
VPLQEKNIITGYLNDKFETRLNPATDQGAIEDLNYKPVPLATANMVVPAVRQVSNI